jgi:hypothetical protein
MIPGTGRMVVKPFELGDYILPPGTVIILAGPFLHYDPEVFRGIAFAPAKGGQIVMRRRATALRQRRRASAASSVRPARSAA